MKNILLVLSIVGAVVVGVLLATGTREGSTGTRVEARNQERHEIDVAEAGATEEALRVPPDPEDGRGEALGAQTAPEAEVDPIGDAGTSSNGEELPGLADVLDSFEGSEPRIDDLKALVATASEGAQILEATDLPDGSFEGKVIAPLLGMEGTIRIDGEGAKIAFQETRQEPYGLRSLSIGLDLQESLLVNGRIGVQTDYEYFSPGASRSSRKARNGSSAGTSTRTRRGGRGRSRS